VGKYMDERSVWESFSDLIDVCLLLYVEGSSARERGERGGLELVYQIFF
jgi:hypothetical protein